VGAEVCEAPADHEDQVMHAEIRMEPWQVGHASGSSSKRCWSSAAHGGWVRVAMRERWMCFKLHC
jgi:hypothetical protein